MPKYFDLHCHSEQSLEGKMSIKKLCQGGIRGSLAGIAITDRVDFGDGQLIGWQERLEKSLVQTIEAKEIFSDRIRVFSGAELAQPYEDYEMASKVYQDDRIDFVLASVHRLAGGQEFSEVDFQTISPSAFLEEYFTQMYTISCMDVYDSLAHLTYPYAFFHKGKIPFPPLDEFEEIIREIYKEVIGKDKALELNLSMLGSNGESMPSLRELKRYRKLGGKYVTIGSNCTDGRTLGDGMIQKGISILQMAGFEHQTIYTGHHPRLIPLF